MTQLKFASKHDTIRVVVAVVAEAVVVDDDVERVGIKFDSYSR